MSDFQVAATLVATLVTVGIFLNAEEYQWFSAASMQLYTCLALYLTLNERKRNPAEWAVLPIVLLILPFVVIPAVHLLSEVIRNDWGVLLALWNVDQDPLEGS
eukprot:TRINITY_DN46850_c0_g1_i1.p1 TRINITY_DN46850_c0_g1~~TRINITY_DN46850_c0_g1_i1.p1  ORF type:complete len:103 (+),score=21.22 TRINITY_DN46850_c0_g1_i1:52-360(+)